MSVEQSWHQDPPRDLAAAGAVETKRIAGWALTHLELARGTSLPVDQPSTELRVACLFGSDTLIGSSEPD